MKLFIPACGDRLTLIEPWVFNLYLEYRNVEFAKKRGFIADDSMNRDFYHEGGGRGYKHIKVTLPTGTELECCRVYIRTNSKSATSEENDYDSITWRVMRNHPTKESKPETKQRFWAKLADCCNIEFSLAADGFYRDRVKAVKLVMES